MNYFDLMDLPKPCSRDILLKTAIDMFGLQGFDGATTRAIAKAAGMPMSQITYHFGGKEGLYLACARMIVDYASAELGPTLEAGVAEIEADPTPARARDCLARLLGDLAGVMLHPRASGFVRFILREQAEPTEAFAILYAGVMGRILEQAARMIAVISGEDGLQVRLQAMAMVGQIIAFRVAQAGVLAFTGWEEIGEVEIRDIRQTIFGNIEAMCDRIEGGGKP